jgi:hypothetical protein
MSSSNLSSSNNWGLTEADDSLHPFPDNEPMWTETMWFSWMVPERKLFGYVYPVYRPNLKMHFGGVVVWNDKAMLPWELPIWHWHQHVHLPEAPNLRDVTFPTNIRVKSLSPGRTFEFGYESKDLQVDLRYEALMQPMLSGGESDMFHKGGHLDQPGHVTGRMRLFGEDIAVDCFAMRDRAWGPRKDRKQLRVGYSYGIASADSAFLVISTVDRAGVDKVWTGFLMRDGKWAKLASGNRTVVRDGNGHVAALDVQAKDELGRTLTAHCEVLTRMVFTPYPTMLNWSGLARWDFDGKQCWGEDQDVWSVPEWRAHAETIRAKKGG